MKVIWKYEVIDGKIEMPFFSKVLRVAMQDGKRMMWVLVNPETKSELRKFVIIATGEKFDDTNLRYVDTLIDTPFVWHIFEHIK